MQRNWEGGCQAQESLEHWGVQTQPVGQHRCLSPLSHCEIAAVRQSVKTASAGSRETLLFMGLLFVCLFLEVKSSSDFSQITSS